METSAVSLYTFGSEVMCTWTENITYSYNKMSRGQTQQVRKQLHLEDPSVFVPQESHSVIVLHGDSHSGQKTRSGQQRVGLQRKTGLAGQRRGQKVGSTFVVF